MQKCVSQSHQTYEDTIESIENSNKQDENLIENLEGNCAPKINKVQPLVNVSPLGDVFFHDKAIQTELCNFQLPLILNTESKLSYFTGKVYTESLRNNYCKFNGK